MYKCPHCNRETFTFWQKIIIGNINPGKCSKCGKKVLVSNTWWIAFIPSLILIVILKAFYLKIIVAIMFIILYGTVFPLVKK